MFGLKTRTVQLLFAALLTAELILLSILGYNYYFIF